MERQHIIKEITDLADRIRSNASDADSLLTDVAHLYEMVVLLKHLPETSKPNGQSIIAETRPIQKEEVKVEEKEQITMDLFSAEISPVPEKTVRKDFFEESPAPVPKKETQKTSPVKKKNDLPTGQTGESVAEKLQHNKIEDLKSAIGINEKFQFINELFDGNMKEYSVAVDQVNSFTSHDEAESYIANLEEVYKWQPDNRIAETFKELVERRFA